MNQRLEKIATDIKNGFQFPEYQVGKGSRKTTSPWDTVVGWLT